MKKWIVAGMLMSSMAQAQEAQDHLLLTINVSVNQAYTQTSENIFKSEKSTSVTRLKITGTSKSGENINYDTGDIKKDQFSFSEIRLLGGDSLEMVDSIKGTTTSMKAQISQEVIRVSSADVGTSLAAELKKQGQDMVQRLRVESGDTKVDYTLDVSDLTCARSAQALSCDLSAQLVLDVIGK